MRRTLLALALILCSAPAFCQTAEHGQITMIRTGWNGDFFAVVTTEDIEDPSRFMNPANCPVKDGYVSTSTSPGYSTYYAAALTAYSLAQSVDIVVDNTSCALGRPLLIGIDIGVLPPPPVTGGQVCASGLQCCGNVGNNGVCSGTCRGTCGRTCSAGQRCCGDVDSHGFCLAQCARICP
jgi:hypothetical protein